jgi:hypothetical protein
MRPLSAPLLAAQKSASREPHVDVVVHNVVGAVRRNDFVQLDATGHPTAKHDVAVAADGSVTRVRMDGGAVKQQRVTDPVAGPWTNWNNLATGMGAVVAAAAKGARVAVVYADAAGTGIKLRESTDGGATYGSEQAVLTAGAAVVDLAVAYRDAGGDLAIAWATASAAHIVKRVAGAFGSASTWPSSVASLNGVAMVYGLDWDIVVTGVEATTLRPSVWTAIYGDGNDAAANTWGSLFAQFQVEPDASITFSAPFIMHTDTYRVNFVEADTFTGGATRTYRTYLHPSLTYVAGPFTLRTPAPVDYGGAEGLALAEAPSHVYETAPDRVYRAADAPLSLNVTADVLTAEIDEIAKRTRGHIDLDNTHGAYAGSLAPIAPGNLVAVGWGYRTSSGVVFSRGADLWIAAHEHVRRGGVSVLRLHVEGGWEALRRSRQRMQIVHTGDSYRAILVRIFARAGLLLTTSGSSSRSGSVVPQFTIHPDTTAFEAVQQALAHLGDRVVMLSAAGADLREPLTGESVDYVFGTDHPLRAATLRVEPPPVAETRVFAAGAFGEGIDFAAAAHHLAAGEQLRDFSSTTGSAAAATAQAHLRQRALDADAGEIVVQPNVGQELLDVVEFSDAAIASIAVRRRVMGIGWRYDTRAGVYEQTLRLGPL